jgi:hypothetical protein
MMQALVGFGGVQLVPPKATKLLEKPTEGYAEL